jgi:hypothetical protein
MTQSGSGHKPIFVPELWARKIMGDLEKSKAIEALIKRMKDASERERLAEKTWVPVCGFCNAWDERNGRTLLEDWHSYDELRYSYDVLRFGPAPTPGSCALKVDDECRGKDYVTPIGEGVLKQQPAKEKAASKKPPSIYPPWPKVE